MVDLRKIIARRLIFFGEQARIENAKLVDQYQQNHGVITDLQFDDLITIEHTNCTHQILARLK